MKEGKLNIDSPVFQFINETAYMIALNVVFVITCIPIITIGPAVAALYQVLMREARGEHGYLTKKYLQHFKEMLGQGIFTFLLYAVTLLVLSFSSVFWYSTDSAAATLGGTLLLILTCIVAASMIYVFPLMARFQNSFMRTIKNAFLISLSNMKYTALLVILHIVLIGLLYLFPVMGAIMLIVGFSVFFYLCAFIFTKLFKPYEEAALAQEETLQK